MSLRYSKKKVLPLILWNLIMPIDIFSNNNLMEEVELIPN